MPMIFTQAYAADQCSISLPLFHGMKEDEQEFRNRESVRI